MRKTNFSKGNELLRNNDIKEAINEYKKAVSENDFYCAYENLGYSYLLTGQYFKAVEALNNALRINNNSIYAKRSLKDLKFFNLPAIERLKVKNPPIVGHLKLKLLNLGFEEKASLELSEVASESEDSFIRFRAASELAVFFANEYTTESAEKSIYWCDKALEYSDITEHEISSLIILKSECFSLIGEEKAGKKIIEQYLNISNTDDLILAYSQYAENYHEKIDIINKVFVSNGTLPVSLNDSLGDKPYDRLCNLDGNATSVKVEDYCVSIIIPAYNAEDTLYTTLRGLQSQTWHNIEVLIVDDCSNDQTLKVANEFATKDSRFKVLQTPQNSGPYVARNIALKASKGDLITINDADDWSHCQKIELQAQHLIEHPEVLANMSNQARMTEDFNFYRRGNPGFYIQPNMSSLMFWKEKVVKTIGFWDSVRFAADSEFVQRLKLCFGSDKLIQLNTPPMSFQRQTEGSLTGSSSFGYHGFKMGARKVYEDFHKEYYKKSKKQKSISTFMEFPLTTRKFYAPSPMKPNKIVESVYDVIIASDFRLPGGTTMSNIEEIKAQHQAGLKTAIVHIPRYDMNPTRPLNPEIVNLIERGIVDFLVYGQKALCKTLIVRYPGVLQEVCKYLPVIEPERVVIVANQTPKKDYSEGGGIAYNIIDCNDQALALWGSSAEIYWAPIGPLVRNAMLEKHADDLKSIKLIDFNWVNIINLDEWKRAKAVDFNKSKIIICRHSRDSYLKWPAYAKDLLAVYPGENTPFNVRVLGGADVPKEILGGALPRNWKVTGFGRRSPKEFLEEKDVYVYFTHHDWIESFGRSIFEAMAVGLPVFLPYDYEPVFKEAAIYCEPQDVQSKILELMSSPDRYYKQVLTAQSYVENNFGYKNHIKRVKLNF